MLLLTYNAYFPAYLGVTCYSSRHLATFCHAVLSKDGRKNRVLKCDVIKRNFWNYGICQDILKEQCPRGLFAKNEHFWANCPWDRSPVMLRKLHTNPSKFFWVDPKKIRRVCMEFSEFNRLTSQRQFAPKCSFLVSRPLGHCSFRISWQIP